jgi:hypothetical protein
MWPTGSEAHHRPMTTYLPYSIARELVAIHERELRDAAARQRLVRRLRRSRTTHPQTLQTPVELAVIPSEPAVAAPANDTPAAA